MRAGPHRRSGRRSVFSDRSICISHVPVVANLLKLGSVGCEEEKQVILKAVNFDDDGSTPFDGFHAAPEKSKIAVLSPENDSETIEVSRSPPGSPDIAQE